MGTIDSKIITFTSTQPQLGVTTTALNFAVALKSKSHSNVIILDFGNVFGKNVVPQKIQVPSSYHTFSQFLNIMSVVDINLLQGYFSSHNSGVDYLPIADEMVCLSNIPKFKQAVNLLRLLYSYIIIDLPCGNSFTYNIFDISNLVVTLTDPTNDSVVRLKNLHESLVARYYPVSLIKLLVLEPKLKPRSNHQISVDSLPLSLWSILPETESENVFNNIEVIKQPNSKYSTKIFSLVNQLMNDPGLYSTPSIKDTGGVVETDYSETNFVTPQPLDNKPEQNIVVVENNIVEIKKSLHKKFLAKIKDENIDIKNLSPQKFDNDNVIVNKIKLVIKNLVSEENSVELTRNQRTAVINELTNDILGYGPLENLLSDTTISEIMVNGIDQIYIEQNGKLSLTNLKFDNEEQVRTVIDRIVAPIGRRIDESSPMVDARLPDGSRVNVIIPPLALNGSIVTIRRFMEHRLGIDELVANKSISAEIVEFLKTCVGVKKNVVISGGTGSGKTTLLNIVSSFIPSTERIVSIEDSAELRLPHKHWVRLESRPANIEGKGQVSIRQLVINSLRMRPDRIIVGECRSGEALDMLQAMNTGHNGSLTTLHANTPRDAVSRLETLVLMAGMDLPSSAIREQIASAVDIIVQIQRMADGTRKIVNVSEITGMEGQTIAMQDIFVFNKTGVSDDGKILGNHTATGIIPTFVDEIKTSSFSLNLSIFSPKK